MYRLRAWLGLGADGGRNIWYGVLLAVSITWLPLVCLSAMEGTLFEHRVRIPFVYDFAANIRFLITLPLLIFSQITIGRRTKEAVRHFLDSGLVTSDQLPAYEDVLRRTVKLRDFWVAHVILFIVAFMPSFWFRSSPVPGVEISSWDGHPSAPGHLFTSTAGFYAALVSIPIYRLILFRQLWLIIVWTTFLRRATQLPIHCTACHPDGAGGLGFLGRTQLFFGPVILAASAVVAGGFANLITYEGASVDALRFEMIGFCVIALLVSSAPLLVVTPRLLDVKDQGLLDYHTLGVAYTVDFDGKWIRKERSGAEQPRQEALLGTADIQSLADLGNSFALVQKMSVVLLNREILIGLTLPPLLPMLILAATAMPIEQLMKLLRLLT